MSCNQNVMCFREINGKSHLFGPLAMVLSRALTVSFSIGADLWTTAEELYIFKYVESVKRSVPFCKEAALVYEYDLIIGFYLVFWNILLPF